MDPTTNEDIGLSAPTESAPLVAGADYDPNAPRSDLMDPAIRDRILILLAALSREWPTMRFGQLVCMVASAADSAVPDSVYGVEDTEFLIAAEERLAYRRANR